MMKKFSKGFTLIELIIVMVMAAALSITVAVFISRPIISYKNVTARGELVDAADMVLRRMARDIQQAVPNSIRVKTDPNNAQRIALEFLNIVEGMRYRGALPGSYLNFTGTVTQFNVIGQFQYATTNATCMAGNCRVVVYNTGENDGGSIPTDNPTAGANVWSTVVAPTCMGGCIPAPGSVTISPVGTIVTLSNPSSQGLVTFSSGVQFALASPEQRVQIVDTPVTYICDVSTNQITRYWNYTINSTQPTNPANAPLSSASNAQLTKDVSVCTFMYTPGTSTRNGVITMTITLTNTGGTVTLMRQVSVDNAP